VEAAIALFVSFIINVFVVAVFAQVIIIFIQEINCRSWYFTNNLIKISA
jgi:hypothetical protein